MNHPAFTQFERQQYLNLETFKKNGEGVKTPVWFAATEDTFFVYSLADAWKVKRVRNNRRVRIAPCDMRGNVKGDWVEAEARIVSDDEAERGQMLLRKKYGWLKSIGEIYSKLRKREHAVIAIRPV